VSDFKSDTERGHQRLQAGTSSTQNRCPTSSRTPSAGVRASSRDRLDAEPVSDFESDTERRRQRFQGGTGSVSIS
jgi:hypothetical protein